MLIPAAAPWFELLRRLLQNRLGESYLDLLAAGLLIVGLAAFTGAVARIRRFRLLRYTLLGLALALVGTQVLLWSGPQREVVLVERIHLVEYGLVAFLYVEAMRHRIRDLALPVAALLATALVGLADEWIQWASPVRTGDLRDVVLNVFAGLIGVLFGLALVPPPGRLAWPSAPSLRAVRRLALATLLTCGVVFDFIGQGVTIRDPEAGRFVSYHRADQLRAAQEDRARRWAEEPPGRMAPLELEDYFRTEAGFHAAARNEALEDGRMRQAWLENRILERWYGAFLDLGKHRWPPEQRRRVAEAAGTQPGPGYRSPVLRDRLYTVPRPLWWSGIAVALLSVQVAGRRLERRASERSPDRPAGADGW